MNNAIAEYDKRIEELVTERDTLLSLVEAINQTVCHCRTLDIGSMSRSLDAIGHIINRHRERE